MDSDNRIAAGVENDHGHKDEIQIVAGLRTALACGVTDIGDDFRKVARELPLSAFAHLYAFDWCRDTCGLGSSKIEIKNLNTVSRHWGEFSSTPSGRLTAGNIQNMRRSVETAKSNLGQLYQFRTAKVLVLTVGRLLQFLAVPPLMILGREHICEMLASIDYEGKGKAAKRVLAQLRAWRRTVCWRDVIEQMRREDQELGIAPNVTDQKVAGCREFLELNLLSVDVPAKQEFVNAARMALKRVKSPVSATIQFPQGALNEPQFSDQITALLRNCQALADGDFSVAMRRYLPLAKGLRDDEIGIKCGAGPGLVASLLKNETPGTCKLTAEEALKLDGLLNANLNIFASYLVTRQDAAYANLASVRDIIVERSSFSQKLRALRKEKGWTGPQVVEAVKEHILSGKLERPNGKEPQNALKPNDPPLSVNEIIYSQWEQGVSKPCRNSRELVKAIDAIFDQDGDLEEAWLAGEPRLLLEPYAMPWEKWPEYLLRGFHRIVLYKTFNPEGFEESPRKSDRWTSVATEIRFRNRCEHYFGYLVQERGFDPAHLSVTLLCDFPLLQRYFEFVRKRCGNKKHSGFAKTSTLSLLNLYVYFMPHLKEVAVREPHWIEKFQRRANGRPGALNDPWQHQLDIATAQAKEFLKTNRFRVRPYTGGAGPLIEAGVGLSRVLKELEVRCANEPTLVLCMKAAVMCRRLVMAILETLLVYPETVLLELKLHHIEMKSNGRIGLKVPKELFRGGIAGGGIVGDDGELEAPDFVYREIRKYLEQARPLLVGNNADEGYFFTADAGQKMSKHWLAMDLQLMLGYRTNGARDLFAASAIRNGMAAEDAALRLHITTESFSQVLRRLFPDNTRKANQTVENLYSPPDDSDE